jgi:hypothetical protein
MVHKGALATDTVPRFVGHVLDLGSLSNGVEREPTTNNGGVVNLIRLKRVEWFYKRALATESK